MGNFAEGLKFGAGILVAILLLLLSIPTLIYAPTEVAIAEKKALNEMDKEATSLSDPTKCGTSMCKADIAIELEDVTVCETIQDTDKRDADEKHRCIFQIAQVKKDYVLCDTLNDNTQCYVSLGLSIDNPEICKRTDRKDFCYQNYCLLHETPEESNACLESYGV